MEPVVLRLRRRVDVLADEADGLRVRVAELEAQRDLWSQRARRARASRDRWRSRYRELWDATADPEVLLNRAHNRVWYWRHRERLVRLKRQSRAAA